MVNITPGNTPLIPLNGSFGIKNLFVKDESHNPTHTFKDRLAFEMLSPIFESIRNGEPVERTTFASISYGNTILSLGYYCKQLNDLLGENVVNAVGFVPRRLENRTLGPDSMRTSIRASELLGLAASSSELVYLDLDQKVFRSKDLERLARKEASCFERFVDVTEGLDRPAYVNIVIEAIENQMKRAPNYIIVPFGAGILCNEIIDYIADKKLETKIIPVSSGNPETIATMLYGPIWVNVEDLQKTGKGFTRHDAVDKKGRKRKPYIVYHVPDWEILSALETLSQSGISSEPSAASGFAVLQRLHEIDGEFDPSNHTVLVINTGNSLQNFAVRSMPTDAVSRQSKLN